MLNKIVDSTNNISQIMKEFATGLINYRNKIYKDKQFFLGLRRRAKDIIRIELANFINADIYLPKKVVNYNVYYKLLTEPPSSN